jgi:hypothetical protein
MGGFINQFTNWRWSFWVLLIWAGCQWVRVLAPELAQFATLANFGIPIRSS